MAPLLWLCCALLVSLISSLPTADVPNKCPTVSGQYATLYGHPDDCQYYFICDNGTPFLKKCGAGTRWSDVFKTCVEYNSHYDTCTRDNAQRECPSEPSALIPHPTACQRYYNCSKTSPPSMYSHLELYEDECPYPQAFDVTEKKCKPYLDAYCGPYRILAKDPCDYVKNLCRGSHCQFCQSRLPSCVGLSNGNHEHPLRLWTPYYVRCENERLLVDPALHYCEKNPETEVTALFSPTQKKCVSLWEVPRDQGGLAPSCEGKETGQAYRSDERPDFYYSCPGAEVFYCGVGNIFNENNQQCESLK